MYFQGLKKKPTFNEIVGYLENDQQILQFADRTYTRLKDDQYYSNLTMSNSNLLSSQSDNLIKDQTRQLERKKQMQTLGLSKPQADANDVASGRSTPAVQQFDIASQVGSDSEDLARVADAVAEFNRLDQEAKQAQTAKVQGDVEATFAGGSSSLDKQREESIERRRLERLSGAPAAQNQGNSPFQARPRSTSQGGRVRTLSDLSQDFQSASGSQDARRGRSRERVGVASGSVDTMTVPLETSYEGEIDFTQDKKMSGTSMVDIDNPFQYFINKLGNKTNIQHQFDIKGLPYDGSKTKIQLIVELMNYDRSKKGLGGRAIIKDVGQNAKIYIEYEKTKKGK